MLLKELLNGLDYRVIEGNENLNIKNVCYDNRKVNNDDLFVCVKGFKVDGHTFIDDAKKKGAVAVIVSEDINVEGLTVIKVEDTRKALAIVSSNFFDNPKSKLKIIGITGTNGKTTSAFMIKSILEKANKKVGLIGTIANYIGEEKLETERTTPESFELHELFAHMVEKGVEYCVMEVSSHSLDLDRVYDLEYEAGIFTNLTRDHLDFHKTFENYYNAKFKLFERSKISVVNIDDEYGIKVLSDLKNISRSTSTFSVKDDSADYKAFDITMDALGSKFSIVINSETVKFNMNIPGEYNIHNALGTIIVALSLGVSMEDIKHGLENIVIPGRCEMVGKDKGINYSIIIDYAHTPDGLENILRTIKGFATARIITVVGCGGDRDKVKRPQMGKIACDMSDIAIITSDNPRTEEPMSIIDDIIRPLNNTNFEVIENRYEAIKRAMTIAKNDDVVLIAGKGHETYQILKDKTIDFDERKVVYEILDK